MSIDPAIAQWGLGILGTAVVAGLGWILRTLGKQNEALAVLVARVGTNDLSGMVDRVKDLEVTVNSLTDNPSRIAGLEADMSRIWGIYDAWRGPMSPLAERLQHQTKGNIS